MIDPADFIDFDEGRDTPSPFYTEAQPCESCGEPTFKGRIWNPEHELWVAVDCSCNAPDVPTCPALLPLIVAAQTVGELLDVCKAHRRVCPLCGVVEMPHRNPAPRKAA